jgi:hypothetical protein
MAAQTPQPQQIRLSTQDRERVEAGTHIAIITRIREGPKWRILATALLTNLARFFYVTWLEWLSMCAVGSVIAAVSTRSNISDQGV